jgi:hypothetical protein
MGKQTFSIEVFMEQPLPASVMNDKEATAWVEVFRDMIEGRIKGYIGTPIDERIVSRCARSMALGAWSSLSPAQKQEYKDYARKRLTAASSQAAVQS